MRAGTGPAAILGLLEALNAELLAHDRATQTLERWYHQRVLGSPGRVVAADVQRGSQQPDARLQRLLRVRATDALCLRRVTLTCGGIVLCHAENRYVPGRLTPEINRALAATDIPFGRAADGLHFRRRTLSAEILFSPQIDKVPYEVLRHRVILDLPDGTPIGEVVETYTCATLGFQVPQKVRSTRSSGRAGRA